MYKKRSLLRSELLDAACLMQPTLDQLCSDVAELASLELNGIVGFSFDKVNEMQDCLADLFVAGCVLQKIVVRTDSDLRFLASRVGSLQSGIGKLVNLVNLYMAHISSLIKNTARVPGALSVMSAAPAAGLHSSPLPPGKVVRGLWRAGAVEVTS